MLKREFEDEQISFTLKFLILMLFPDNVDFNDLENFKFELNELNLKLKLEELIQNKQINEAEQLLFQKIENDESNKNLLKVAIWFYFKLNKLAENYLIEQDFSKIEILNGLKKIEQLVVPYNGN